MSAPRAEIVSQKAGVFARSLARVEAARRRNPIRLISRRTLNAKAEQGEKGKGGERANLVGRDRPKNHSAVLRSWRTENAISGKALQRVHTRAMDTRYIAAYKRDHTSARIDWILGQHLQPYRAREFIRARHYRATVPPPTRSRRTTRSILSLAFEKLRHAGANFRSSGLMDSPPVDPVTRIPERMTRTRLGNCAKGRKSESEKISRRRRGGKSEYIFAGFRALYDVF